jgi:hypothetical protein
MRCKMEAQVYILCQEQDNIMRRFNGSQNNSRRSLPKAGIVNESEMYMLRGFHFYSGAPSPWYLNSEKPGTSMGFIPQRVNGGY